MAGQRCFSDSDCSNGILCSFAVPEFWCNCTGGEETCYPLGACLASATCPNCAACVAAVGSFVKGQQSLATAAEAAANWDARSSSIVDSLQLGTVDTAAVKAVILASPNGNVGKRAGSLRAQMQCELGGASTRQLAGALCP